MTAVEAIVSRPSAAMRCMMRRLQDLAFAGTADMGDPEPLYGGQPDHASVHAPTGRA